MSVFPSLILSATGRQGGRSSAAYTRPFRSACTRSCRDARADTRRADVGCGHAAGRAPMPFDFATRATVCVCMAFGQKIRAEPPNGSALIKPGGFDI